MVNAGDYITGYAGQVPVVVIRNEEGLAAFVNVRRHRRHEVMKGRGNSKMMQCGYHAWTYDLTGCLKGAPRSAAEPNFRLEDYPLLPIRVESLGPFVFVLLTLVRSLCLVLRRCAQHSLRQRHRPGESQAL